MLYTVFVDDVLSTLYILSETTVFGNQQMSDIVPFKMQQLDEP